MDAGTEKTTSTMDAPMPPVSWNNDEFEHLVREMVTDELPRLFAVVQVLGEQEDGRVAAWGMAFDDHVEIVSVEGRTRMRVRSPDRAVRHFARASRVSARVVWAAERGTAEAA